ncbi:hypothetical protein CR513_27333, partial [Mucuna pruriens]
MVSNTQQFGTRGAGPSQVVNEAGAIDNLRLENQLTKLTSLVRQLVVDQHQQNIPRRRYQRQSYQSRPYDSQQFRRQPYQPSSSQGQYSAQDSDPSRPCRF